MKGLQKQLARVLSGDKFREHATIIFFGLLLTCITAFLYLFQPKLLSTLDLKIYDSLLQSRASSVASDNIVIIDIDEKSLLHYGQWPWPRYRFARLLDNLQKWGAFSVGIDIIFAEPDRSSLVNAHKNILTDLGYNIPLSGIPRQYADNDVMMAKVLRRGPFVLGYQFLFEENNRAACILHPVNIFSRQEEGTPASFNGLFKPSSADCLYGPLAQATPSSGFLNIMPDHDGIIRRVPLIMEYGGQYYVHLSLATLLMAVKPEQMILRIGKAGTESLAIDGAEIPLDDKGRFLIPFRFGRGTFRHIPASDILNGTTGSHEIKDRIVLIGASAPGLHDIHATPTDPVMAGAEVQANIIDAVLQGDFLVRPKGASYYEFIAIILIGILSTICFALCRVVINLTLFLLFSAAAIITAILLFRNGMYLSPLYPLLVYASNFSVLSILNFWRNEKRLKKKSMQHLATHDAILEAIANITETRDAKTGDHIRRTRSYVKVLAEQIRHIPAFAAIINDEYLKNLCMSAPLHDMGKVGVADSILLKSGLLTPEEFEEMKMHTQYGRNVLDAVQNKLIDDSFLRLAREMVVSHHERWDGKGYPDGLKGEDIPLSGRIMAIADVYDALTSARPYRDKMSHETAVDIIMAGRGSQFDPQLVDAFAGIQAVFRTIANDTICRLQ